MANVKLVFSGTETSTTEDHSLVCYLNAFNEIYIQVKESEEQFSHICLDRSTAIKLHRELKKQISFIQESEVTNG